MLLNTVVPPSLKLNEKRKMFTSKISWIKKLHLNYILWQYYLRGLLA